MVYNSKTQSMKHIYCGVLHDTAHGCCIRLRYAEGIVCPHAKCVVSAVRERSGSVYGYFWMDSSAKSERLVRVIFLSSSVVGRSELVLVCTHSCYRSTGRLYSILKGYYGCGMMLPRW